MPGRVICFESFRSNRGRQRGRGVADEPEPAPGLPFQDRLASVLNPRQIAHRRAMLAYGTQLRTTTVSPISRTASRSRSLTSASWIRSIGSMKGSLLNRND
jgi:hypothetical protein